MLEDVYFLVLYKRYMFISGRQFVRFVAESNNNSHVMTPEMCLSIELAFLLI